MLALIGILLIFAALTFIFILNASIHKKDEKITIGIFILAWILIYLPVALVSTGIYFIIKFIFG